MNGATVESNGGQWLVRGAKAAIFDLPPISPPTRAAWPQPPAPPARESDLDLSDVERTSKRIALTGAAADDALNATSEITADDIVTEMPIDERIPFEVKVPAKLHARAAQLTARLAQPAPAPVALQSPGRGRTGVVIAILGVIALFGAGAGAFLYLTSPIPSSNAHTFKAASATKVMAQRASGMVTAAVPTVHVDSLPRARR
jgi:phosphotransferase system HPr-like phosphotransfer protein